MNICALLEPDTSGMNGSEAQQAALSDEQLAWAKELYADIAPQHTAAISPTKELNKPVAGLESAHDEEGALHGK